MKSGRNQDLTCHMIGTCEVGKAASRKSGVNFIRVQMQIGWENLYDPIGLKILSEAEKDTEHLEA